MKFRKAEINNAVNILAGINISKIPDKDTKSVLYADYLYLRRIVREARSDEEEIVEKFRSDFQQEFFEVAELRDKKQPVEGHDEFLSAEKDALKLIADKWNENVEVETKLIPFDAFISGTKNDSLTLEQTAMLEGIVIE